MKRRRGGRDAQVVCLPPATARRSRPLPLRGSGCGTSGVGRGVRGGETPGRDRWGRAVRLSRAAGKREMRTQAARQRAAGRSGRSRTFLTPGRGSNASRQTASHPGIRRHSAASAGTAVSSAAQKRQTSGDDGDASAVRWELPATVWGALAQRSSSARTGSADVP